MYEGWGRATRDPWVQQSTSVPKAVMLILSSGGRSAISTFEAGWKQHVPAQHRPDDRLLEGEPTEKNNADERPAEERHIGKCVGDRFKLQRQTAGR